MGNGWAFFLPLRHCLQVRSGTARGRGTAEYVLWIGCVNSQRWILAKLKPRKIAHEVSLHNLCKDSNRPKFVSIFTGQTKRWESANFVYSCMMIIFNFRMFARVFCVEGWVEWERRQFFSYSEPASSRGENQVQNQTFWRNKHPMSHQILL